MGPLARAFALERSRRDRPVLALLLPLPWLALLILLALLGRKIPEDLPIDLVDLDGSALSRSLARSLDASPSLRVAFVGSDPASAARRLRAGEVAAVVALPRGLERDASRGLAPASRAWVDGQNVTTHNTALKEVRRVLGTTGARIEPRNPPDPVAVQARPLGNPSLDYQLYLAWTCLPSLWQAAFMVLLVRVLGRELRERSVPDWLHRAGTGPGRAILSRTLFWTTAAWISGALATAVAAAWIGIGLSPAAWAGVFASLLLLLACDAAYAWLLVGSSANLRMAGSTAGFLTGPAFAFAGVSFPLDSMPRAAFLWAQLIPTTHHFSLLAGISLRHADASALLPPALTLAGTTLVTGVVGFLLLRKRLLTPSCWGRR